jgi:hypothetical protein
MAWGVGGWLLTNYLRQAGSAKLTELRQRVAAGLTTIFASHYTDRVSLAGALAPEAVAVYGRQATGQKYLIVPTA